MEIIIGTDMEIKSRLTGITPILFSFELLFLLPLLFFLSAGERNNLLRRGGKPDSAVDKQVVVVGLPHSSPVKRS